MADVIEVIHKINYEVNDVALDRVTGIVRNQIAEISRLTILLRNYQRQLSDTRDVASLETLSGSIARVSKQIEIVVSQTKSGLLGLKDSIFKGLGVDLESGISEFLSPVKNALTNVGKEGDGAGISIASIGKQLFSFSGILPVAISLVASLADEFLSTSENAEEAAQNIANVKDAIDQQVNKRSEGTKREGNRLDLGVNAAKRDLELLQAKNAAPEKILEAEKKLNALRKRELVNEKAYYEIFTTNLERGFDFFPKDVNARVDEKFIKFISETLKESLKITKEEADKEADVLVKSYNTRESIVRHFRDKVTDYNEQIKEIAHEDALAEIRAKTILPTNRPKKPAKSTNTENPEPVLPKLSASEYSEPTEKPSPTPQYGFTDSDRLKMAKHISDEQWEKEEKDRKDREDKEKAALAKRAENIDNLKKTYLALAQAAADAFNMIYEAQIKSLDKEIEVRKERVDKATELAKRGETDQLEAEQERLDKAVEARDAAAKKQMQLNAILQASNQALALTEAIGAVVRAASAGDPYTIAFRVAAAVAALVAGIAAVSTAFGQVNNSGFAEGGFTGQGGKYEAAGIVHKGEFVMNAENTKRYRPLLEAMHGGIMPVLKQPDNINQQYASRKEMSGVEKKLDSLIDAVESSHTKVNARVDQRGIAIITERYKKAERRRWS